MTPSLLGRDPDVLAGPGQPLSLVGGPQPAAERAPLSNGHSPGCENGRAHACVLHGSVDAGNQAEIYQRDPIPMENVTGTAQPCLWTSPHSPFPP